MKTTDQEIDRSSPVLNETCPAKKGAKRKTVKHQLYVRTAAPRRMSEFSANIASRVQVHGVADFIQASSNLARFFWMLLIATCITIAIYSIMKSVDQFIEQPIQTTVRKVPQTSMAFPPIYICPSNYLNYEKIRQDQELQKASADLQNLIRNDLQALVFSSIQDKWNSTLVKAGRGGSTNWVASRTVEESTMASIRHKLLLVSFNSTQVFRDCHILGNQLVKACDSSFFLPIVSNRGVCYQMTIDQFPGQRSSLDGLYLFIDLHAHKEKPVDDIQSFSTGVTFTFGKEAHPYSPKGYLTGPGRYVKFSMYKEVNRLLSQKDGNNHRCLEPSEIQEFVYLKLNYSSSACKYDCLIQIEIPRCNCSWDPIDPTILHLEHKGMSNCGRGRPDGDRCFVHPGSMDEKELSLFSKCSSRCLEPCHTEEYAIHDTSMELGSPHMRTEAKIIKKEQKISQLGDPEYWKTSAVMVHIGFAEMNYWLIEESQSITIIQMISDIGGQVGLWLGASIFSVCQLSALLMTWCHAKLCKRALERRKQKAAV